MLLNQICARALKYQAQRRLFSSNINIPLALYNIFNNLERYDDEWNTKYALEKGSTRYWELNRQNPYYCIGASGPINNEHAAIYSKMFDLIDFDNLENNKLHVDIVKCPNILSARLVAAFSPQLHDRGSFHVIKLSYDHYTDKIKGKLDGIIAANYIGKKFNDRGNFCFYSGWGVKNADTGVSFRSSIKNDRDIIRNLHVNFTFRNGCCRIQSLKDNEVGVVYVNQQLNRSSLKKIMENRPHKNELW